MIEYMNVKKFCLKRKNKICFIKNFKVFKFQTPNTLHVYMFISLPNLLAGRALVPELIQDDANPEKMGLAILEKMDDVASAQTQKDFTDLHKELKRDASERAAAAVSQLIEQK